VAIRQNSGMLEYVPEELKAQVKEEAGIKELDDE